MHGKRILLTGGHGFIGKHVQQLLLNNNNYVFTPSRVNTDLRNRLNVISAYSQFLPDIVIHLAASVGGIGANAANPGKYLYDNLVMGLEMMDVAVDYDIERFVNIGTSCSYPAVCPNPVKEESLWQGYPNPVTAPYGVAKLALMEQAKAYRKQYGLNAVTVIPANVYGPGDSFNVDKCHVIPALILKALQAKKEKKTLEVWGTGKATREFIYVEDCAKAIVKAADSYNGEAPINLGTGIETSILELAHIVSECVGFTGYIHFDPTFPDGQLNRVFDVSRAKELLDFTAKTELKQGVQNTVDWYLNENSHSHSKLQVS